MESTVNNTGKDADYHIIGASFAGSLLSRKLLKFGNVLLIDKQLPGQRINCGGGLPLDTYKQLDVTVNYQPVSQIILSVNSRNYSSPCEYVIVNRAELDKALWQKAIDSGVQFLNGEYQGHDPRDKILFLNDSGEKHHYKNLILAYGIPSKKLQQNTGMKGNGKSSPHAITSLEVIEGKSPFPEAMYVKLVSKPSSGYCWIFPMPDGKVNVGGGYISTTTSSKMPLDDFKEELGFGNAVPISKGGGIVPLSPVFNVQPNGCYLFGDTAGMVYPLNGEGLKYIHAMADPWAECIGNHRNLNRHWHFSSTFLKLFTASLLARIMLFSNDRLSVPLYQWVSILAAKIRKYGVSRR